MEGLWDARLTHILFCRGMNWSSCSGKQLVIIQEVTKIFLPFKPLFPSLGGSRRTVYLLQYFSWHKEIENNRFLLVGEWLSKLMVFDFNMTLS